MGVRSSHREQIPVERTDMNTPLDSTPVVGPRRVVLLRHGETADNRAGRFLGRSDPRLNDRGAAQARSLAPVVAALDGAVVASSPARRAIETATLLGIGEPVVDDGFREVDFGEWEGMTQAEVARHDPGTFDRFDRGEIDGFPGGEAVAAARQRTLDALDRHAAPLLVVVTHATLVRIAVTALLGLPVTRYRSLFGRPGHLSWTELERTTDGWRLLTYDDRRGEGRS